MPGLTSFVAGLPISAFAILAGLLLPCLVVSLYLSFYRARLLFTGAALWVTIEVLRLAMILNISLGSSEAIEQTQAVDVIVNGMLASFMVIMLLVPQVIAASGSIGQNRIVIYCRVQAAAYAVVLVVCALTSIESLIAPLVSGWCLVNGALIAAAGVWRARQTKAAYRLIALCWAMGFGVTSLLLIIRQEPALMMIANADPLWIAASVARLLFVACGILLIGFQAHEPAAIPGTETTAVPTRSPYPVRTQWSETADAQAALGEPLRHAAATSHGALRLDVSLGGSGLPVTAPAHATHAIDYALDTDLPPLAADPSKPGQGAAVWPAPTDGTVALEHAITRLSAQLSAARAQLSETAELQGQVSSLLSHELRAPLSTISAAAQSLDLILSGSGELVDGRIARIRRAVLRMTELLDAFFSAERTNSGPLAPIYQEVNLSSLAASVIAQQQPDASHTLVLDAPNPVMAWCDPSLCAVVLRNLTHNAIKYSPANRPIVVRVRERRAGTQHVGVISVLDHGAGMDAEEMKRIFERNYRRPSHREVKGTGIGLYLARCLCEHQSGKLEVESTLGSGSCFFITLPGNRPNDA